MCALKFRTVPGGDVLFCFLNCGSGEKPQPGGRRSAFWQAWSVANGGPARRGQVMSPRTFANKLYEVEVGRVTKNLRQQEQTFPYSVVRRIIKRLP